MKCELCGLEFRKEEGEKACKNCLLSKSCGMIKCPRCGYEIPDESSLSKILKKWSQKLMQLKNKTKKIQANKCAAASKDFDTCNLTCISKGLKAEIVYFNTKNNKKLHKMMVMGLLPGTTIELKQKFPSYLIKAGNTQLVIDEEIAQDIFVKIRK